MAFGESVLALVGPLLALVTFGAAAIGAADYLTATSVATAAHVARLEGRLDAAAAASAAASAALERVVAAKLEGALVLGDEKARAAERLAAALVTTHYSGPLVASAAAGLVLGAGLACAWGALAHR